MRFSLVLILCLCLFSSIGQERYSRVKIDLSEVSINTLNEIGLETDHGMLVPGLHFVNEFSAKEIAQLDARGIPYYVLVPDVQKAYHDHKHDHQHTLRSSAACGQTEEGYDYATPENYTFGSMGGYHTFSELLVVLDDMRAKYPNLISAKAPVDGVQTWEGNDIWWLRISDNPDTDEADEPEALYTALHHAREPNGLSQMIFYMWYLLENYETDPEVKHLVDNTEMYFMPCLNPDGYIYNETTDPEGGGFWRKNRRPAATADSVGVDLNRNYGFAWAFDNFGSSPNPQSNTYRGPSAFSEPETAAVRDFCIAHNFEIALNYHTFGNLMIHPWGFDDSPTDEDALFKAMGNAITRRNDFFLGTGTETVGYVVNGDSDDYMYGEEGEKAKIYAMTPEVGPRFWPQPDEIDFLNKSCMHQNLTTAHCLLNYYDARMVDIPVVTRALEGAMTLHVTKAGLRSGDATVQVVSTNPHLTISMPSHSFTLLAPEDQSVEIAYTLGDDVPSEETLTFDVVTDNGSVVLTQSYSFEYRNSVVEVLYTDDVSSASPIDLSVGSWSLTEESFISSPTSLTDSEGGLYEPNSENIVMLAENVDLTEADHPTLQFSARWDIETDYDHCRVQVSRDGIEWVAICGLYTRMGIDSHETEDPLYDGESDWIEESMDLSDFSGDIVSIRLVLTSDAFLNRDGFYIDDISIVNEMILDTSTSDLEDSKKIQIYPITNNGSFTISSRNGGAATRAELSIINVSGIKVYSESVTQNDQRISTALPSGSYFIKYKMQDHTELHKITIVR